MKKKKFRLLILSLSLLFCSFTYLTKTEKDNSFATLCKNSDAYYTHSYIDVSYVKSWSQFKKYTSINNKLVINNTNGVENYAFLKLNEYESNHLKKIKIRTLKANGKVVELDSSLVFKKGSKKNKFEAINYPIPAVEPGDTIETSYIYYENLKQSELKNYGSLNSNLPSKNSQYSIKAGKDIDIRYKTYNNLTNPEIVKNDSIVYVLFSIDELKSFEENEYSCFPCELPYFYYSLEEKDSKLREWGDVYNEEFNFLTQPMALDLDNASYYKRWKRRTLGEAKDSSKFHKFSLLYTEVLNNFEMKAIIPEEFIKSSGYFLKNKKFDNISIRRFYRQVLEDLEIDYWAVFAKSKRAGEIDLNYIRKGEFDHVFFAFKDDQENIKFIYPHTPLFMYQLNEIPTSLYNTNAVLAKPVLSSKKKKKDKFITRNLQMAEVDSVTLAEVKLPGMNTIHNRISQTVFGKVDVVKKITNIQSRFLISGGLSTDLRSYFNEIDKNEELSTFYDTLFELEGDTTVQVDSVMSRVLKNDKPFSYIVKSSGVLNNTLSFINDQMISLSIDKLLNHSQIENNGSTSNLNYYLDYKYADTFNLYLDFPSDIEILGLENGNINVKNSFGEYFFKLTKTKHNQLKLSSSYKIKKDFIPKEEFNDLVAINEALKQAKGLRFVINLKKSK